MGAWCRSVSCQPFYEFETQRADRQPFPDPYSTRYGVQSKNYFHSSSGTEYLRVEEDSSSKRFRLQSLKWEALRERWERWSLAVWIITFFMYVLLNSLVYRAIESMFLTFHLLSVLVPPTSMKFSYTLLRPVLNSGQI